MDTKMVYEKPQKTPEEISDDMSSDSGTIVTEYSTAYTENGTPMVYIKTPKNPKHYACYNCDFFTSNKKDYDRHLLTAKHKNGISMVYKKPQLPQISNCDGTDSNINVDPDYKCLCGNTYKHRSGLYRHRKRCNKEIKVKDIDKSLLTPHGLECIEMLTNKDILFQIMKQHTDLQNAFIELVKDKQKTAVLAINNNNNNNIITNNSNNNNVVTNNSFNLQFYLNETCKNALNINEFIDSIVITLEDLEQTGILGYAEGISRIFIKNLKDIADELWPIHCSDLKRHVIYIKIDGVWNKETECKAILTKAVKQLANKNMVKINDWKKKYPDCDQANSRKNDMYLKIMMNSMCGGSKEETDSNMNKIVNNIAKHAVIDKINN